MKKIKFICLILATLLCTVAAPHSAQAATKLTPTHLYSWAKNGNLNRLRQFQRYINLKDQNQNTALCIAQQHQDSKAYTLLLKFGASTKVSCHNNNDPICAVIAGEKTKVSPAAWWLLGAGAAAGAYALLNNDGGHKHKKCPAGYEKGLKDCSGKAHPEDWIYERGGEEGGVVCGRCVPKQCPAGYDTKYQSVSDCGTTGANGWQYTYSGTAGDLRCGKCDPYQCSRYDDGKGVANVDQCITYSALDVAIDTNVIGYAGDDPCYKCTYTCKDDYYTSEQTCLDDNVGYTCSSVTQNNITCWKPSTPATCPEGYDTQFQSVSDCGTTGANGWQYTYSGTSGGLRCGKCTAYQSSRYDSGKGVANVDQCITYSTLDVAIDTNVIGYAGNDPCYKCTYTCKDEYYTSEQSCLIDNPGYTCSSTTENNVTCWAPGTPSACPDPSYTPGLVNCNDKAHPEGYTYTSSGSSGGQVCGKCTPKVCTGGYTTSAQSVDQCGTTGANGYSWSQDTTTPYAGDLMCSKCTPYQCSRYDSGKGVANVDQCTVYSTLDVAIDTNVIGYAGEEPCYKCTYTCKDEYYTSEQSCLTDNPGYTCSSTIENNVTCWAPGTPSACPDPSFTPGLTNCNGKAHPEGYTYTSSGTSGGQVCGKCTPKTCNSDYNTQYQSVDNCGSTGANGYAWSQDTMTPYAGDLKCGKCTPYQCSRYDGGKGVANVDQCTVYDHLVAAIDTNVIGYAGESPCYKCTYTCKDEYYSTEDACTEGGYTCSSATENNVTCWWHSGSGNCPTDYPEKGSCPAAKTGYTLTSSSSTTVGSNICYKCNYACDTANGWEQRTSCWAGKTCQTQTLPYGAGTCYKPTGCSTDYPHTSQAACEEGGYTCTESYSGSGCWKRGDASGCAPGYDTAYQSVDNCGTKGANGYTYTSSGTSGGLKCGKCTPKKCTDYAGGDGAADVNLCQTYSTLDVAVDTNVVGWSGENPCYKCSYSCKEEYYETEDACLDDYDSCSSITLHNHPCWYGTGSLSTTSNMTMINTTERNITSSGNEDVYGLKGTSNLENAVDDVTGEAGVINITHNSTGKAVGLYGEGNGTVANRSGASINIANNTDGTAVGMHTSLGGTAINEGTITITGNLNTGTAIGIYGEGANRIINAENAIINVTSGNAYGIYLKDGNNSEITNAGTIYANGDNAHGIYVDENAHNATIINTGSIYLNGTNAGDAGITLNGGTLRNMSLMSFNGAANLNDLNGLIYLEDGGVYQAESLEGDLNVGTSNVLGGNQDTYVNEGALQADNIDNLNLASESAMFTARATTNANGNGNDVVLERKDFAEFTPNESIANYLEDNYRAGNMEEMYDEIKSQRSQPNVNLAIAKDLGYDIFPNFADENYLTLKSLNRNITDTVLTPTDEVNRVVAGTDYINLETDNKGFLSGYDLDATSMYTFGDKRLDNQNRLGLGLSITRLTSDYDRGGDRKLTIFNLFVPYMHKFTDNLRLASILSAGYGYGEYDRDNNRESDITDIFYGWTNELRYTMDLNGFAELEPALMLNALGYTEDGFDEGHGVGAIESKKTHNMSVEGGVGLFLKKKVSLEKYGRLGFKIGGAYYREMADPYDDIEARNRGAHGWYKINDYANIYDRDRALLEAAVDYEYKNIGLYAKYNQLIQRNDPKLIDLGLKVNF